MAAALHAVPAESPSPDHDRLATLEDVIEHKAQAFVEVGLALAEIRDRGLFRVAHSSFRAYLADRWGFGQQWAYGQMYAAQVARAVAAEHGSVLEGMTADALRPLVPLLNREGPEAVGKAWTVVQDRYGSRRRPPSRSEVRSALADAGLVTCAPEPKRPPQIGQIGESIEVAAQRVARIRKVLNGRPLPPETRLRAGVFAERARNLAAELEALADTRAARAQLAARETGVAPARGRAQPVEVFCDTHGRVRDVDGICVDCGVPDIGRA